MAEYFSLKTGTKITISIKYIDNTTVDKLMQLDATPIKFLTKLEIFYQINEPI